MLCSVWVFWQSRLLISTVNNQCNVPLMNRSPVLFTPSLTHSHNTKLPLLFLPHWRHHRFVCARTKRTLVETKGSTVFGVKRWCGKPGSAWLGQSSLACLTTFSWQDRGRTPTLIGPRRKQKPLLSQRHVGAEQGWLLEIKKDNKYETGVDADEIWEIHLLLFRLDKEESCLFPGSL